MIVTETTDRKAADKILQDQIKSLADRMTSAEKRIKDLESRMDEAERQIKLLWEKLSETEARVSALESKLYREVEPALHDLQSKVGDVEDQIKTIKSDLDDLKDRIDILGTPIMGNGENRNTPDGSVPDAKGECSLTIRDMEAASSDPNTSVNIGSSAIGIYANNNDEFWCYANIVPVNFGTYTGSASDDTLSTGKISVAGGTILETKYGNQGNPDGIPVGYMKVKVKANHTGIVTIEMSDSTVDVVNFNYKDWIPPSTSIPTVLTTLQYKQGQSLQFNDAASYMQRVEFV